MSAVPGKPIDPDTPAGAVRLAQRRRAQPNGWWGMALFLCSEVTIFGTMIATYFYLQFGVRHWPPRGIAPEKVADPSIATGVLVPRRCRCGSRLARLGAGNDEPCS